MGVRKGCRILRNRCFFYEAVTSNSWHLNGSLRMFEKILENLLGLWSIAPQFWGNFGKYAFLPFLALKGGQTVTDFETLLIVNSSARNILSIQKESLNSVDKCLSYFVFKTESPKTFVYRHTSSIFPRTIFKAGLTKFPDLV